MTAETPTPNEIQGEPCPAPLEWQEIAQKFHETVESRMISTPTSELTVTEFGTGQPIVFFPPMAGSCRLYCLTAWLLKEEYRSILIDAPQFHKRPKTADLVQETAEALSLIIEHFCPGGADIYASTFSSQVALQIMLQRPEVIRSAVLQTAWAHRSFTTTEWGMLQLGRVLPTKLRQTPFWQSTQIENHRRWFPPFDETRFGFLLQEAGESSAAEMSQQLQASMKCDLRPRLSQIRQPVMVIACEGEGQPVAASEQELAEQLPNVRREEMYHSGHFPYLTHPHRLLKLLKPFWNELQGQKADSAQHS